MMYREDEGSVLLLETNQIKRSLHHYYISLSKSMKHFKFFLKSYCKEKKVSLSYKTMSNFDRVPRLAWFCAILNQSEKSHVTFDKAHSAGENTSL